VHRSIIDRDRAASGDREDAAELDVGQRELGSAACELELAVDPARAGAHAHATGDHAHAAGVGDQFDVVSGQIRDVSDMRRERALRDADAANARWTAAAVLGVNEASDEAREIGIAAAIDLDRYLRRLDADLVGPELARQQRLERCRSLDRIGGDQRAERDVGQADRAGQRCIYAADPRRHARGGTEARFELAVRCAIQAAAPAGMPIASTAVVASTRRIRDRPAARRRCVRRQALADVRPSH